jgi:hypothetical protein
MRCGRGFIAKRKTAQKTLPRNIPTLATCGSGSPWMRTQKLVPSWMLGQRDLVTAPAFVSDLASRLSNRVQITTDGHRPYLEAVENAFGMQVDYSNAPIHSAVQRLLPQTRQPCRCNCPQLLRLQLHPDSFHAPHVVCAGSWRDGSPVGCGRPSCPVGVLRAGRKRQTKSGLALLEC